MRLTRLTKLAVTVAMVAAVVPATAVAAPDNRPDPVLSEQVATAEQALQAIETAFDRSEKGSARSTGVSHGGELTQQLIALRQGYDRLSPEDQVAARAYLARPTDGTEYYCANYGKNARPTNDCKKAPTPGSNVCVHWARKTADAPPLADKDGDGVPNQVEMTRDTMNLVWDRIVGDGGYRAPLPDRKGPDKKLDIYLADIGGDFLYGYCGPEPVGQGRATAAYCVLDDDYAKAQFPTSSPRGNLRVTAAHEFFHAVQFAYDEREDSWLMESTATWMEDELFDNVNDNRYYLTRSALSAPQRPLDTQSGSFYYGNWIWWRYLTERFPREGNSGLPTLVRGVWELTDESASNGTYSMAALAQVLRTAEGAKLAEVFADFAQQNRYPDDPTTGIYEEGRAYRKAPLSARHKLDAGTRPQVAKQSPKIAHMSSRTIAFFPKNGYAGDGWTIRVNVNLPRRVTDPSARIALFGSDGSVTRQHIALTPKGKGAVVVDFSRSDVKRVELTLVNADHSYKCNKNTQWSCDGVPGPERPFNYRATTQQAG